jgi:hypothetical protein
MPMVVNAIIGHVHYQRYVHHLSVITVSAIVVTSNLFMCGMYAMIRRHVYHHRLLLWRYHLNFMFKMIDPEKKGS